MTEKFRVLIVDDHQEIRTALRANLEALELDLDLVDVPSGEEAIIEVVGTGINLLIADIGLPGLSGIELYNKLKTTYPEMQVILITGLEDEEIHQEITEIGAEAFFFKPLKMPEFLNAVRRTMGLEPVVEELEELEELSRLTKKNLSKKVTSRIADLRGELGAISINVIRESGVIAAETGVVPDTIFETTVMPLLLNTFSTTNRISTFLGNEIPKSVWYFSGDKYDLFWTHVDSEYGMIVITNPVTQNNDLTWVLTTLDLAIQEIREIVQGLREKAAKSTGKTQPGQTPEKKESKKTAVKTNKVKQAAKADLPKGSNGSGKSKIKSKTASKEKTENSSLDENDIHEFWKAASLEEEIQRIDNPESLSFDQAQKLGFITNGDDTDS